MRQFYPLLFILLFAFVQAFGQSSDHPKREFKLSPHVNHGDYQSNTLIVKYKDIPVSSLSDQRKKLSGQFSGVEITEIRPMIAQPVKALSFTAQSKIDDKGLNRIYVVNYTSKRNIEYVINQFLQDESVEYAEPSYIAKTFASPNDPYFLSGSQSYLNKVRAPQAWNIQNDAAGVIVAVIDTGSELNHPDLAANIFINYNDPVDGKDNDGDGYIDNYYGWDFGGASLGGQPDNDPNVKSSGADHGVHVSGLVSAVTDNGIGVASIAKKAKLMILKASVDGVDRSIYYGYQAMIYAADHGAKIINCSWGSNGKSSFEQDIIDYAISKGCLVVAAAGNDGNEVPIYPAAYNGVLAVANVTAADIRNMGSSYGYHVDISAPGSTILNTTFSGNYGVKGGTSMAAPLVSSAAALVAAKYPELSGIQIGEILKQSADDIYGITENQAYLNKLGTGRLNVEKALTIVGNPGLRKQAVVIHDETGSLNANSTAKFDVLIKNVLTEAKEVTVELKSLTDKVTITNAIKSLGTLAESEEKKATDFLVKIGNVEENEEAVFCLEYTSSVQNYKSREYFSISVNRDYIDYSIKNLATTITSNGRVGYEDFGGGKGQGFIYKGKNLVYEASLMIGNAKNAVSNNARVGDYADNHFVKIRRATKRAIGAGEFLAEAVFDDSKSPFPLNVEVINRHITKEGENHVLVEYEVENVGERDLDNVYLGLFTDWDIDESDKNITKINQENRLAYAYSANLGQPYGGIRVVSEQKLNYYPMSYMITGDFLETGDFTIEEKYQTLSGGIAKQSLGDAYPNGADIMFVLGVGPFNLKKGKTEKVGFAFLAADNLDELITDSQLAQQHYDDWSQKSAISKYAILQNYPNPVVKRENPKTTVSLEIPEKSKVDLKIFDLYGNLFKKVYEGELVKGRYSFEVDMSKAAPGIYYGYVNFNGKISGIKIAVL